jgi:electron transport complex protein RnfD
MAEQKHSILVKYENQVGAKRSKRVVKIDTVYAHQLMCLISLCFMTVWKSGIRTAVSIGISVLCCIFCDYLFCKLSGKTYQFKDISTPVNALCIVLLMPSSVEYGLVIGGAVLAMAIKHIFGGKNTYIFNPASVSIAVLIICYRSGMVLYPKHTIQPDVFNITGLELTTGIEYSLMKLGTAQNLSLLDVLLGNFSGPMGATHILLLVVCAICLMGLGSLSVAVTLTGIGSAIVTTLLFSSFENALAVIGWELIGGYLLFGFIFMAGDPRTVPKTVLARIFYGVILGVSSMLFRHYGKVEGSFVFALLLSNAFSMHLDDTANFLIRSLREQNVKLRKHLSSFERVSEKARKGELPSLSDTQEIIVPLTNYNMPPIDNKVTKVNRKKQGFAKFSAIFAKNKERKKKDNNQEKTQDTNQSSD